MQQQTMSNLLLLLPSYIGLNADVLPMSSCSRGLDFAIAAIQILIHQVRATGSASECVNQPKPDPVPQQANSRWERLVIKRVQNATGPPSSFFQPLREFFPETKPVLPRSPTEGGRKKRQPDSQLCQLCELAKPNILSLNPGAPSIREIEVERAKPFFVLANKQHQISCNTIESPRVERDDD
ncbi:hypothetical protein QBC38DRAFT_458147 [Podospora fimiseda]|uniref:Uncharacterized protein n=1 Tax=Podospora fimiseda TaxID=252190 RepID=A0AAN7BJV3_9PEZI|nr:hypothetical protein QBC38DRAFT_458147 [Podospora fimiseda]